MAELLPPEGSEDIGTEVMRLLSEIVAYREDMKLPDRCVRYYQLRRAKHWKHKNPDLKLVSANLLGSHHTKMVNMLTDNNPTFNVVQAGQMGEDAQERLSLMTQVIDNWWNETEQQHVLEESIHTGELYGFVGEMASYNVDVDYPNGDVEIEMLDPLYFSLYPPKCRRVSKAQAVLRWYPISVVEAQRKWPEVADQIVGDASLYSEIGDTRQDEATLKGGRMTTWLNHVLRYLSGATKGSSDVDQDETFIVECWVKDYTEVDGQPKYPGNIRRVRVASAGNVVLDDLYNPALNPEVPPEVHQSCYLYSRFPVSYNYSITDPASPFGMSDFEQLEQLNMELNKAISQFTKFKDAASRMKLINPKDSGITNEELDNSPGIINPTNSLVSQAIRYIDPPNMGTDIQVALGLYKNLFNEIAGSFNDILQGQRDGSQVIAAKSIAMLLEEASRMARGKIRNYSKLIRERGRMYVALAQQWYDTPRWISFQKDGDEVSEQITREALWAPIKISVVIGSTMPVSRIQEREESLALLKMGVIDQEEALKKFGWKNYRDVIKRMQMGPIGQMLQKIAMTGVPPQMMQYFQQLARMEDKEIQKALQSQQLPPFPMLMIQAMAELQGQQQQPQPNPEEMKAQAEAQMNQMKAQFEQAKLQIEQMKIQIEQAKVQAEIGKIAADTELVKQKIESEVVDRQVRAAGVELDRENIRIEKAKAVSAIQNERAKSVMRQDPGRYNERGMVSNNEVPE